MDVSGKSRATEDYPWDEPAPGELIVYGDGDARKVKLSARTQQPSPETLALSQWQMSADNAPLAKSFDDRDWYTMPDGNPPVMGADGDYSAFAWYRTHLTNSALVTSLNFQRIGDRATFFVAGKYAASFDLKKGQAPEIVLNIPAGKHDVAVFTAHFGRAKFAGYIGPIDKLQYQKGLCAPVTVNGTNDVLTLN